MSEAQLFQKLLPVNINFVQGESPSPIKLNGIFNYIQASYYVIESYLGNGIDYGVHTLENRKMVFNLASSIGQAGNLYKPTNKMTSLYNLHQHYGALHKNDGAALDILHSQHTDYVIGDEVLGEYLEIIEQVNIPVSFEDSHGEGHQFGIIYKGAGTVTFYNGDGTTSSVVCDLPTGDELKELVLSVTTNFIDYISFEPFSDVVSLKVFSTWLVGNTDGLLSNDGLYANNGTELIFNRGCAIPVDNGVSGNEAFWRIAPPCQHSLSTAVDKCDKRTCDYCIGNTYDVFVNQENVTNWTQVGQPICGGDVGEGGIHLVQGLIDPSLVPSLSKKYTPVAYAPGSQNIIYTLQSCLLMKSKPFLSKYRPFAGHDNINAELTLTKNESALYDMNATYNPIRYNVTLRSAGRPDILYVHDAEKELSANSFDKMNIIGGSYNISQMLLDVMRTLNEKEKPQVAVYSD